MATPNVGILTNAGKNLIDQVNAGQTKITFSKIVFSSMNNNQLTDDQIKALTTVAPQEIVVNNPKVTLDNNTGETRIRATGNNEALTDGVYVKTYAVYAKDDSGNEILYGITVSPNPNYLPEYDGVTPQAVTYSYKVNISNTSNITFTNSNDIYVSDTDLAEAIQPYAKTVDVNQQLDKKVIDNHDNTITANNLTYDLSKTGITPIGVVISGSFNDLPLGTVLTDATKMTDGPDIVHGFTTTTFYFSGWGNGRKAQIAIADNANLMYFRTGFGVSTGLSWNSWVLLSDDSKVVHLSGANNFDTVPTVKNNPLLLASSLPPDLARTGQPQTFTAAQTFSIAPTIKDASTDKGDNQAATMADLKSVEASAWHIMSGSSELFKAYNCWYKINKNQKRLEIMVSGVTNDFSESIIGSKTILDLSSIITSILRINGTLIMISQNGNNKSGLDTNKAKLMINSSATTDGNEGAQINLDGLDEMQNFGQPAYVYYDDLQDAYK